MRWYHARLYFNTIEPVEVLHSTDRTLTVKDPHYGEQRRSKVSEGEGYFPSRRTAKLWLLRQHQAKIDGLTNQINFIHQKLMAALALPEEDDDVKDTGTLGGQLG